MHSSRARQQPRTLPSALPLPLPPLPQVEFWEEPGTLMDGLQLVRRVTVGGAWLLLGGGASTLQRARARSPHQRLASPTCSARATRVLSAQASGQAPPMALWTSIHTTPKQLHTLAQDLRSQQQQQQEQEQQQQSSGAAAGAAAAAAAAPESPATPAASHQHWLLEQSQQQRRLTSSSSSPRSTTGSAAAAPHAAAASAAAPSFQLKVMSPAGELKLQAQPHLLVEWLKAVICSLTQVPVDQQRLICAGRQLEDGMALDQYGLGQGSVVHVVVRLRGY